MAPPVQRRWSGICPVPESSPPSPWERLSGSRFAAFGLVLFGALLVLFSVTRVFWINAVLLFGAGACMVMVFAVLASLVQLIVPDAMRGRVMSIYMMAFRGGMPIGSLVAGYVATLASAPTVLTVNGVLMSLVAMWFLVKRPGVREL